MSAVSPLSGIFLLHIALEIPVAIQGLYSPANLPFLQLNNTAVVMLKLYSSLVFATCVVALLVHRLPDFLPGKRGFAIGLCLYHTICSTVLFQAPRFIPHSFGGIAESAKVTPELLWGTLHGLLGFGMVVWWQLTLPITSAARAAGRA